MRPGVALQDANKTKSLDSATRLWLSKNRRGPVLYSKKTAAARVRAAAECIQETLTSLTALLNNSLIDCSLLVAPGGSSQAER